MVLIDTSVWIDVLRDKSGSHWDALVRCVGDPDEIVLSHFVQLELLQGAKDEREWSKLDAVLTTQDYLELPAPEFRRAARLFFELRRRGKTVRSPIDCCIAQVCIFHRVMLLHRDRDFTTIASVCELSQTYLEWS